MDLPRSCAKGRWITGFGTASTAAARVSCLANPVLVYGGVTTSVNKGRAADVTTLDICKGFDMVPHNFLLS